MIAWAIRKLLGWGIGPFPDEEEINRLVREEGERWDSTRRF